MTAVLRIVGIRIGQALTTAFVLATICFTFVHALPGDLALRVAAAKVGDERVTPETADRIRKAEGLDQPLIVQYGRWMMNLARGDLGRSLLSQKPVSEELAYHARYTLQLGAAGWLLSYVIALPLGVWAGFRPGEAVDRATMTLAVRIRIQVAHSPVILLKVGIGNA